MRSTLFMLTLLTVTLACGLTGPWGERLAPAVLAQVSPAQVPAPREKASPGQAGTQVTPSPGGIALSLGADDPWVYYLAPSGYKPRKLVRGRDPALSPDGKKMAYLPVRKDRGGFEGLMVLDLATGQTATLLPPSPQRIEGPSWSPRGDLLAFIYHVREIHLIRADGSGRQKIFSMRNGSYQPPQWASDGKSLFVNDFFNQYQIDLAGQELAKTSLTTFTGESSVSSSDRFVLNPQSPQLWAFTVGVQGTSGDTDALFLFDTRTRKRTRLTPPDMIASHPCWSRDGQYLYFIGSRGPLYQERESPARFYRLNRDGTGLTELRPEDKGND